ncbi:MAG: NAD(P)-binding domain-containing protein, partial [Beijerinckiaceae bacterium]
MIAKKSVETLIADVAVRQTRIGVIGLGYVGLPLVLTACRKGFSVVGFDINAERVAQINRGESFIQHIPTDNIVEALKDGRFAATTDFDKLREVDVIIIAVPTPLSRQREPDLSYVE